MARFTIPNMYSANRSCIEGLTDFAKSCVATHISEDIDRLTDCVGQSTICVTLQKLKMGTSLERMAELFTGVSMRTHSAIHRRSSNYPKSNFFLIPRDFFGLTDYVMTSLQTFVLLFRADPK